MDQNWSSSNRRDVRHRKIPSGEYLHSSCSRGVIEDFWWVEEGNKVRHPKTVASLKHEDYCYHGITPCFVGRATIHCSGSQLLLIDEVGGSGSLHLVSAPTRNRKKQQHEALMRPIFRRPIRSTSWDPRSAQTRLQACKMMFFEELASPKCFLMQSNSQFQAECGYSWCPPDPKPNPRSKW